MFFKIFQWANEGTDSYTSYPLAKRISQMRHCFEHEPRGSPFSLYPVSPIPSLGVMMETEVKYGTQEFLRSSRFEAVKQQATEGRCPLDVPTLDTAELLGGPCGSTCIVCPAYGEKRHPASLFGNLTQRRLIATRCGFSDTPVKEGSSSFTLRCGDMPRAGFIRELKARTLEK